jgi:hypothetical protein
VYIRTPFPDLFYAGTGVLCLPRRVNPPTIAGRIEKLKKEGFYAKEPCGDIETIRFNYGSHIPTLHRPILLSFHNQFNHSDFPNISIGFDCKEQWKKEARKILGKKAKGKKICVVKVPTLRNEWVGLRELSRNPRKGYVEHLANFVKDDYFTVSALDLAGYNETLFTDGSFRADLEAHNGEFGLEAFLGLIGIADLVITPPCSTLLIGIAFNVPTFAIFGGFSPSMIYTDPLKVKNYGYVEPKKACFCFNVSHNCEKDILKTEIEKEFVRFMGRPKKIKAVGKEEAVNVADKKLVWSEDYNVDVQTREDGSLYIEVMRNGVLRKLGIGAKSAVYVDK